MQYHLYIHNRNVDEGPMPSTRRMYHVWSNQPSRMSLEYSVGSDGTKQCSSSRNQDNQWLFNLLLLESNIWTSQLPSMLPSQYGNHLSSDQSPQSLGAKCKPFHFVSGHSTRSIKYIFLLRFWLVPIVFYVLLVSIRIHPPTKSFQGSTGTTSIRRMALNLFLFVHYKTLYYIHYTPSANSLMFITRNRNAWNPVIIRIRLRFWCPSHATATHEYPSSHAINRRFATCRFRFSLGRYAGSVCINTVFDDPRMLLDLVERQPLLWVDNKELKQEPNVSIHPYWQTHRNLSYAFNQIFGFWRHVTRNCHFTADDSFVRENLRVLKWRFPN